MHSLVLQVVKISVPDHATHVIKYLVSVHIHSYFLLICRIELLIFFQSLVPVLVHIWVADQDENYHSQEQRVPDDMRPDIHCFVVDLEQGREYFFHRFLVNSIPGQNILVVNIPLWVLFDCSIASGFLREFEFLIRVYRKVLILRLPRTASGRLSILFLLRLGAIILVSLLHFLRQKQFVG